MQQSVSTRKVIDSEDTDIRQLAKPDGTLVTEKEQTRQHEELVDDALPEPDGGYDQVDSGERIIDQKVSTGESHPNVHLIVVTFFPPPRSSRPPSGTSSSGTSSMSI